MFVAAIAWIPCDLHAQEEAPVTGTLCALVDGAAKANNLPVDFFTRLIWRESGFRANVVSPAGAQGIAQFMPGTAAAVGLADPFDPAAAIPASAKLLSDLRNQFGNLGLAAAAYNAGPTAVTKWQAGQRELPYETQAYVAALTGKPIEDWNQTPAPELPAPKPEETCEKLVANLRVAAPGEFKGLGIFAPWGVQLAGNFSKGRALAAFTRERNVYASVIGGMRPFVLASRLRSRGTRAFYRVRLPAATRGEAQNLCNRLHAVGGACLVLRS